MNLILCVLLMFAQGGQLEKSIKGEENKYVWVHLWDDRIDEGILVYQVDKNICYQTNLTLNVAPKERVFYSKKAAYAYAIDKMSEDILEKRKKINKLMDEAEKP